MCLRRPERTRSSNLAVVICRLFVELPSALCFVHPQRSCPITIQPSPQTPQRPNPESRRLGRTARSGLMPITLFCRRLTASQAASSMMRRRGTAFRMCSSGGLTRIRMDRVLGSMILLVRLKTSCPTYSSLWRMPFPRLASPLMVDARQWELRGPGISSSFNREAIVRALRPSIPNS